MVGGSTGPYTRVLRHLERWGYKVIDGQCGDWVLVVGMVVVTV